MMRKKVMRLSLLLVMICSMYMGAFTALADEVVTSVEFDNSSPVNLFVEDKGVQLKLLANIQGSSTKKDVTGAAYWSSDNSKIVTVDKGLLSGVGSGTVLITAKYGNSIATINVKSDYLYKTLDVRNAASPNASLPESIDVRLGDKLELEAVATTNDSASREEKVAGVANWASSDTSVATVSKGVVTLVGKGKTKITVSHKGVSDNVTLNVTSPFQSIDIVSSDGQELKTEMKTGDNPVQLKAFVTWIAGLSGDTDMTSKATWKTSNSGAVKIENGLVTPVGAGVATVTVEYLGVSDEIKITVLPAYQAIQISRQDGTSLENGTVQMLLEDAPLKLKATALNSSTIQEQITDVAEWTTSNTMVASVMKGEITPKGPGTAKIKVTYKGQSNEITVVVYQNLTKVSFEKEELEIFKGDSIDLPKVFGTTIAQEKSDVSSLAEWNSGDDKVLAIEKGKLVAKAAGTVELKATVTVRGTSTAPVTFTAKIKITVQEKVLTLLATPSTTTLVLGREVPLPTIVSVFENGTQSDATSKVTWKVSSPNLLLTDKNMKGLVSSKVTLTATYLNKSVNIPVYIEEEVTKFVVTPNPMGINPGKSATIKVTGTFKNGKTASLASKIAWKTSNDKVATVKGASVKGVAEGTTKITGEYQGQLIEVNVNVTLKVKRLNASEKSLKLAIGGSKSLKVVAEFEGGRVTDVTSQAVWSSSNSTIVSVSKGQIKALKKGSATIKAVYDKKTVSIRVSVK